ncbi:MAG: hypothetical protein ACFCVF_11310 [Kineosporiaceae bacterium]
MTISRTTAWGAGAAALCVLLLVATWFLLVSPQRAAAAEARAAAEAARVQNGQLESRISQLQVEFAQLPQRRLELTAIRRALPAERGLAGLLDELDLVAADTATALASVVAGTPTTVLDVAAAPPTPTPSATPGEPTATDVPAPQTSAAPAAPLRLGAAEQPAEQPAEQSAGQPIQQPAPTGQPGAAPGGTVLAAIPLTVTVGGDFLAVADFVRTVQSEIDRAFVVDSVDIIAGTADAAAGGTVEATLTGRVFVFLDPQAATDPTSAPTTEAP